MIDDWTRIISINVGGYDKKTFAAITDADTNNVIVWGRTQGAILSSDAKRRLQNSKVISITPGEYTFAAMTDADKDNVIVWGLEDQGGKLSSDAEARLKNSKATSIIAGRFAYAAITNAEKNNVAVWGKIDQGGKLNHKVTVDQLKNSKTESITTNGFTFVAITDAEESNMAIWGKFCAEVECSKLYDALTKKLENAKVKQQLGNTPKIVSIAANQEAWAAVTNAPKDNFEVWGTTQNPIFENMDFGTKLDGETRERLRESKIKSITASSAAFAAITADEQNNVIVWGNKDKGGRLAETIKNQLEESKVISITASRWRGFFAAITTAEKQNIIVWEGIGQNDNLDREAKTKLGNSKVIDIKELGDHKLKVIRKDGEAFVLG